MRLSGVGTGLDFNLVPGGVRWRSELAERVGGASWRSELAEWAGGVGLAESPLAESALAESALAESALAESVGGVTWRCSPLATPNQQTVSDAIVRSRCGTRL
jgi:hypothetical protein